MADGGDFHAAPNNAGAEPADGVAHPGRKTPPENVIPLEQVESLMRSRGNTPNPFSRQHTSLDLDDYFVSPCPVAVNVSAASSDGSRNR